MLAGSAFAGTDPARATTQRRDPALVLEKESTEQISRKQQQKILKYNFEKMKQDVDELAALAKALQEELDKTTENMLSLQLVEKADKIEKLAKRIKSNAKGY